MATEQRGERSRSLSDLEKSTLAKAEQPAKQGWYPDPLAPDDGIERFFSRALGQPKWTGATRPAVPLSDREIDALERAEQPSEQGWYPDPLAADEGTQRFFSKTRGQSRWTGKTRQAVSLRKAAVPETRNIDINGLTDDEAVWSHLVGKPVLVNILDRDEWSIAILAQVTDSFLIFQVDNDKGRYPLMWRHEYVRALDVRHRQWNTGRREVTAFRTINPPGEYFEVFGKIDLVHDRSVVVQN
jgi:hypothetical protein